MSQQIYKSSGLHIPLWSGLHTPLWSPFSGSALAGGGAVYPEPGDHLVTAISGDNLTDESGNQLTA